MEQTLVLVKGDGVRRRLVGEIIRRIEAKRLDIDALKLMDVGRELAEEHHAEHRDKPFFEELVEFITSTPVVAMRIKGDGAIKVMRNLTGSTNPAGAARGAHRAGDGPPAAPSAPPPHRRPRPPRPPPPPRRPRPAPSGATSLSPSRTTSSTARIPPRAP